MGTVRKLKQQLTFNKCGELPTIQSGRQSTGMDVSDINVPVPRFDPKATIFSREVSIQQFMISRSKANGTSTKNHLHLGDMNNWFAVVDHLPSPIVLFDEKLSIVWANHKATTEHFCEKSTLEIENLSALWKKTDNPNIRNPVVGQPMPSFMFVLQCQTWECLLYPFLANEIWVLIATNVTDTLQLNAISQHLGNITSLINNNNVVIVPPKATGNQSPVMFHYQHPAQSHHVRHSSLPSTGQSSLNRTRTPTPQKPDEKKEKEK